MINSLPQLLDSLRHDMVQWIISISHVDSLGFVVRISLRANPDDRVVINGVPISGRAYLWSPLIFIRGNFTLKTIIFVCIHDAPGGFTVSGQTKEKSRCYICVDGTASIYLPSSRKLVFMRHRRFSERKHKYRKMKRHFDNIVEKDSASKWYTEKLLFEIVKNIQVVFGKGTVKG
jgi:hypothetical protein